jgi:hypothetical protein
VASRTIYVLEISGACYKKDSLTRANPTNTAVSMKKRVKNGIVAVIFVFGALSILNFQPATAFAQGTAFTYQGRVTDNGTNFTGLGQFKFALVTSTNANHTATATANAPSGGFITGYSTTFGGNGYLTAPAVTVFGGGGSGAAAHANLSAGAVASLAVDNPGNGAYTNAPTVLIAPPPAAISYTTYWSNDGTSANGSEPSAAVSVGVSNGLFTVVLGDATLPNMAAISASLFSRPGLQLRIWFNDGVNGFAALDPAQNLTPTPYATFANAASNLFNGLTIQQNDSGAPDVIGGSPGNFVSPGVIGATIAGGGRTNNAYPETNSVTADFGAVSGGWANTAAGQSSSVGGGYNNLASGDYANIAGGYQNTASNAYATVSGGHGNWRRHLQRQQQLLELCWRWPGQHSRRRGCNRRWRPSQSCKRRRIDGGRRLSQCRERRQLVRGRWNRKSCHRPIFRDQRRARKCCQRGFGCRSRRPKQSRFRRPVYRGRL